MTHIHLVLLGFLAALAHVKGHPLLVCFWTYVAIQYLMCLC
jgi:hypothetical protein